MRVRSTFSSQVLVLLPEGVGVEWHLQARPRHLMGRTTISSGESWWDYGFGKHLCSVHASIRRIEGNEAGQSSNRYLSSVRALHSLTGAVQQIIIPNLGSGEYLRLYGVDATGEELARHVFAFPNVRLGILLVLQIMGAASGRAGSVAWVQDLLAAARWVDRRGSMPTLQTS